LFGKGISAFLPALPGILGGSAIFMFLMDLVTNGPSSFASHSNLLRCVIHCSEN
jgi:hypothetical protein